MDLKYTTERMQVFEITSQSEQDEIQLLLPAIPELLTPAVVEHLPPYFHGVQDSQAADVWLTKMFTVSRLYLVRLHSNNTTIGFVFVSQQEDRNSHIGYLLAESYWGKGLAYELLTKFIQYADKNEDWISLIGGVDIHNAASVNLLKKLGFEAPEGQCSETKFYQYSLYKEG